MPHRHRLPGLLLLLCCALPLAWADEEQEQLPSARIEFTGATFGLLVGYSQGRGSLRFQRRDYPFSIRSYKLLSLGAAWTDALGVVYNLERLEDFQGRYQALQGGFTAIQGGGATVLRNDRGVTIYLQNLNLGVEVSLGGSVDILLEEVEDAGLEPAPVAGPAADRPPTGAR